MFRQQDGGSSGGSGGERGVVANLPSKQIQQSALGSKVSRNSLASDPTKQASTGIMSALMATLTRRNQVGPGDDENLAEKASQKFNSIATEEERDEVLQTIRQVPSPLSVKRQLM